MLNRRIYKVTDRLHQLNLDFLRNIEMLKALILLPSQAKDQIVSNFYFKCLRLSGGNRIIYNSKRNTVKYCKAWQEFFVLHGILQIIVCDAIMII